MPSTTRHIGEDWLAVWIGLPIFAVSLTVLAGADVLGWVIVTNVWTNLSTALAPVSKACTNIPAVASPIATYLFLLVDDVQRAVAQDQPQTLRAHVHRRVLDQLPLLDTWLVGQLRRDDTDGYAKIRHRLVVATHRRGRLHSCASGRFGDRQFLSAPRRVAERGGASGVVH